MPDHPAQSSDAAEPVGRLEPDRPIGDPADLAGLARDGLGIDELRPEQEVAAAAAATGRDVLAVMPTGSGKTAVYELAAAVRPGATVVVSPLIALQHDQVERIRADDVGGAAALNATVTESARADTFDALAAGELEFVFLASEQLTRQDTMDALRAAKPSLFVVDEAHCVASWGHDFRPEYRRLGEVIDELDHPTVLALTASAAPTVRRIVDVLRMRNPLVLVRGFDRPNLQLTVHRFERAAEKRQALLEATVAAAQAGNGGSGRAAAVGLVYLATRKAAERLAVQLDETGIPSAAYHGGLGRRARDQVQHDFMDGKLQVVVATTAFGMGIDKPDVRFVHHGDVPPSLDDYHQEIGRGGRDGEPASAALWYRPADLGTRRFQTSSGEEDRRALEQSRAEMLRGYAETTGCRRRFLLAYFGQEHPGACGSCDNCQAAGPETAAPCGTQAAGPATDDGDHLFRAGRVVRHVQWGRGEVLRVESDQLTVLFDSVGYRTLSRPMVEERRLLRPVSGDGESNDGAPGTAS